MDIQEYYKELDQFILLLKSNNLVQFADKIDFLVHKVAWTTGSELLEELSLELEKILTEKTSTKISQKAAELAKLAKKLGNFK